MDARRLDIPHADVIQLGEGPDLLLLHTLLAERTVFDRVLPDLAARHRLTVPNLPGYGDTPPLAKPERPRAWRRCSTLRCYVCSPSPMPR